MRLDHDPKRRLLPVRELRDEHRLLVDSELRAGEFFARSFLMRVIVLLTQDLGDSKRMAEAQDKGNALELAVRAVEGAIISQFPDYNQETFQIWWKKRIIVDEVEHEIDIWVEMNKGYGYQTRFIFECKNRVEKATKNDIIILSEKIDASQAAHGYLVAREFAKSAFAQAKKDKRVTLLKATDCTIDDDGEFPVFVGTYIVDYADPDCKVQFLVDGEHDNKLEPMSNSVRQLFIDNTEVNPDEFLAHWVEEQRQTIDRGFNSGELLEGKYERQVDDTRSFLGNASINGLPLVKIVLHVNWQIGVYKAPVMSHYNIETRGRYIVMGAVLTERFRIGEHTLTFFPSSCTGESNTEAEEE